MPPTADHREQARLCHLREMGAGDLRRDSRREGKLARGQRTAIEKGTGHVWVTTPELPWVDVEGVDCPPLSLANEIHLELLG